MAGKATFLKNYQQIEMPHRWQSYRESQHRPAQPCARACPQKRVIRMSGRRCALTNILAFLLTLPLARVPLDLAFRVPFTIGPMCRLSTQGMVPLGAGGLLMSKPSTAASKLRWRLLRLEILEDRNPPSDVRSIAAGVPQTAPPPPN